MVQEVATTASSWREPLYQEASTESTPFTEAEDSVAEAASSRPDIRGSKSRGSHLLAGHPEQVVFTSDKDNNSSNLLTYVYHRSASLS